MMPAVRKAAIVARADGLGGSAMPTKPSSCRLFSASVADAGWRADSLAATARTRRPEPAYSCALAREVSTSRPRPKQDCRAAGIPERPCRQSSSRWADDGVVIRFRRLSNGNSPTRGEAATSAACCRPSFSAAMIKAISVGSPNHQSVGTLRIWRTDDCVRAQGSSL